MNAIELICFPGAPNLPIFVAQEQGCLADNGVAINMSTTPNSAILASFTRCSADSA